MNCDRSKTEMLRKGILMKKKDLRQIQVWQLGGVGGMNHLPNSQVKIGFGPSKE